MNKQSMVVMNTNIEVGQNDFVVNNNIVNNSSVKIALFNRIQGNELDGTQNFLADNVYIDVEGKSLHVKKLVLPIPDGLQMSERITPQVSVLAPGKSVLDVIKIKMPVKACNPLTYAKLRGGNPESEVVANKAVQINRIVVAQGYFEINNNFTLHAISPAYADIFRVWPPGPAIDSQQILVQQFDLSTPLLAFDYNIIRPK